MQAYNITMSSWQSGSPVLGQGWAFGLPPGIAPEQWPLCPHTGYPLLHGFTVWLPPDYRVHGPDIVALSFFATPFDHNDGGPPAGDDRLYSLIVAPDATAPTDPDLLPFWERARAAHPRTHRMEDILGCAYAVVLLTQAEFTGAPCRPELVASPLLAQAEPPAWLTEGAAQAFSRSQAMSPPLGSVLEQVAPGDAHLVHRALVVVPRVTDPNAGKPPRDTYGDAEPAEGGYQSYYYWEGGQVAAEHWREHAWAVGHEANHLGGTMRPIQATPDFTPYYIGFEEDFGGYNFGGGNAQLDVKTMRFDWACG